MTDRTETLGEADYLHPQDAAAALDALFQWYEAMGVDEALSDSPRDFFAEFKLRAEVLPPPAAPRAALRHADTAPTPQRVPASPIASPDEAVSQATALARQAETLAQLHAALAAFEGCALRRSAQNLVFGKGIEQARVLVMGETPDRDDDNSGEPYSGLRGVLLERMLRSIGIVPAQTYLTQIVPWFPPGNVMPARHHIDACLPFALRHIELAQPQSLICLGWAAEKLNIGKNSSGLSRFTLENRTIPVLSLSDLNEIMRSGARKRKAWEGLRLLAHHLQQA